MFLYFLVHLIFSIRIQVYLALKTKLYLLIAHIAKLLWQLSHVFQYVPFIPNVQGSETVPTNRAYMSQESSLTNKDIVNLLQQSGINICFVHVLKWQYFQNYRFQVYVRYLPLGKSKLYGKDRMEKSTIGVDLWNYIV